MKKSYLSPFHILNPILGGKEVNKTSLKRAKKRMLAEFELLQSTTIEIQGKEYDKNDILNLFDSLQGDSNLPYHEYIYSKTQLLNFLEGGDLEVFKTTIFEEETFRDKDFQRFIEPYFNLQFNQRLTTAVKSNDYDTAVLLAKTDYPLSESYFVNAFSGAYRFYRSKQYDLINLANRTEKYHIKGTDILPYFDLTFRRIFNNMPDFFWEVRDRYAMITEKISIELHNRSRRTILAVELLKMGLSLKSDEETRLRLKHVLRQISPYYEPLHKKEKTIFDNHFEKLLIGCQVLLILYVIYQMIVYSVQ